MQTAMTWLYSVNSPTPNLMQICLEVVIELLYMYKQMYRQGTEVYIGIQACKHA